LGNRPDGPIRKVQEEEEEEEEDYDDENKGGGGKIFQWKSGRKRKIDGENISRRKQSEVLSKCTKTI
jgi:hypothetical protein